MKSLLACVGRFALAVPVVFAFSPLAEAHEVYSGCAVPPASPTGHVWYVDPVNGRSPASGGLGTQAAPWNSLTGIIGSQWSAAGYTLAGYTRPLLSTTPYYHRIRNLAGQGTFADTADDPPVQPGDAIVLASGDYGDIGIGNGYYQQANVNASGATDFVWVVGASDATPVFNTLNITGGRGWLFQNIVVQSEVGEGAVNGNYLVHLGDGGTAVPTQDIVFEQVWLQSALWHTAYNWAPAQWLANARNGLQLRETVGTTATSCISFSEGEISAVRTGASLSADHVLFDNNIVQYMADDGVDFAGSNMEMNGNWVGNNLAIGDGNHDDGFQGTLGDVPPGQTYVTRSNITIDGNAVVRQADGAIKLPSSYLQGIDDFDGDWDNLTVTSNLVIAGSCHGMAFSSIHNSLIANNTVVDDGGDALAGDSPGCTWPYLSVGGSSHEGPQSTNYVVANNVGAILGGYNATGTWTCVPDTGARFQNNVNVHGEGGNYCLNGTITLPWSTKNQPYPLSAWSQVPNNGGLFTIYNPQATGIWSAANFNLNPPKTSPLYRAGAEVTGYPLLNLLRLHWPDGGAVPDIGAY